MTGAVNLRDLLFDDPARAADTMSAAMLGKPDGDVGTAVGALPDVAKKAALSRLTEAADGLLAQDVTDVFCNGWRKHTRMVDAARATLAQPGERREVNLDRHATSFAHEPGVELWAGDQKLATLTLQIQLELVINGVKCGIRAGRLVDVGAGSCEGDGSLAIAGMHVTQRQFAMPLRLMIRLPAEGWPLVDGA
jgi:hypothetical protein